MYTEKFDGEPFSLFYKKYFSSVLRYINRRIENYHDAEDLITNGRLTMKSHCAILLPRIVM